LSARAFPKQKKKGVVAILTTDEKRMKIPIKTKRKQVTERITEKQITRRLITGRKIKKS
jgi:hypothetical protein